MVTIQANKYRAKKRLEANIDEMRLEQWRNEATKSKPKLLEKWNET